MYEHRLTMLTADGQHVAVQESSAYQRRFATRTNWTAVSTHEVLQHVQTQVGNVDGGRAVRTNVEQQWVPARLCNMYEHRSMMLMADEQHIRM